MKDHHPAAERAAVLITSSIVALATPVAARGDEPAPSGGSATYQCRGDYSTTTSVTPVTFGLISEPTEARPGDSLSLSGNLGVAISDSDVNASRLVLAQTAKIDATDFALVVTIGDTTSTLKPASVVSTPVPVKPPLTLSANVSYPDLVIPATAEGAVTIRMPSAKEMSTKVAGAPAKVTFTTKVAQGGLAPSNRNFACWTDDVGPTATIARIPLSKDAERQAPPAAVGTDSAPPAASAASGAGGGAVPAAAGGGSDDGAAGAVTDLAGTPASAEEPAVAAPAAAARATNPPTKAAMASAAIPAATSSDDTFVPGWILAFFLAIFPAAAVAGAVLQWRRLRRLNILATASA